MVQTTYDIIKAHGGEIKVKTAPDGRAGKEEEGIAFINSTPL